LTTLTLGLTAIGLSATAASAEQFNLRLSTVVNSPHPWVVATEWMAKEVEKQTNGDVMIKVFAGGALGKDQTAIDQMRLGAIDFVVGGTTNAAPFVKEFQIFSLSYLFKDLDAFRDVTAKDSPVVMKLQQVIEDRNLGFKLMALGGGGTRNMSNNVKPVKTPADLDGIKMRVPGAKVAAKTWGTLGALPTSLPWTELYTAVQTGVVNAFESSISGYRSSKLYEVAQYHAKTEHQVMTSHISMSTATYNRLPENYRKIVVDVAAKAGRMITDTGDQYDKTFIKELQEKNGVKVNDVDKAAFMEKLLPLHDEFAEAAGAGEILAAIRKMQK
ncbi:MAG: TRAP transporter substrate-binding protein, partial [Rhodospirillales bacterium]|nr:TRAP transporter substrate-binding protein [Rhodospirillales bacterium]